MKLLAWDTSSKTGCICALEWDPRSTLGKSGLSLIADWTLNVDSTHSEGLLWGIDQVLKASRWKLEEIDVFGVGVGPGSFTGLRIGITTARTLAHTLGKPLVGVSSLSVLARPVALWAAAQKQKTLVVACTDACKGELFALWGSARSVVDCLATAQGDSPGVWKRGVEETVIRPSELVKVIKKKVGDKLSWIAVGEGRRRHLNVWEELQETDQLEVPVPFADLVQGKYLGLLAWEAYQAGLAREGLLVHPRYVRASDAELKLKAGLL